MATVQLQPPKTRRWTRSEYYRMAELGWFLDQRVERIDGEVFQMTPHGVGHAMAIQLTSDALEAAFGPGYRVREQLPLEIGDDHDPEPDLAVVRGQPRDFQQHPRSALLVVEVADSSLAFDRGRKASLYARAGITDYWIVNLMDRQLEVLRNLQPSPTEPFGFGFTDRSVFRAGDFVNPLAAPQARVAVADLLP